MPLNELKSTNLGIDLHRNRTRALLVALVLISHRRRQLAICTAHLPINTTFPTGPRGAIGTSCDDGTLCTDPHLYAYCDYLCSIISKTTGSVFLRV
jgi:hypothetical protein